MGRIEMVVRKDGGIGCSFSLFIMEIKVIMCFQFLKKKKGVKRKEGRKETKQGSEGKHHRGNRVKHTNRCFA